MYEDRFDLCTLQRQLIEEATNGPSENSWWKRLIQRKSKTASSPLCYVAISHFSMPVKRTKELRALTGWYAFVATFHFIFIYCSILFVSSPSSIKLQQSLTISYGWFVCCRRYYFSLFLELSDIGMPFIRAIINKVTDAISFFLVCLIGRSLGLIYTGIRQSLKWKWDKERYIFTLLFIEIFC